jgi:hypothetical protein
MITIEQIIIDKCIAEFKFACDTTPPGNEELLKVEIISGSRLISKYAFFLINNP